MSSPWLLYALLIGVAGICAVVYFTSRQNRAILVRVESAFEQFSVGLVTLNQGHTKLSEKLVSIEQALKSGLDNNDKALRSLSEQHQTAIGLLRSEQQTASSNFQQGLTQQIAIGAQQQGEQLKQFADVLHKTNALLNGQLEQLRQTVEARLKDLQTDNANKLELIRKTVDEKLHATLEQRLGESFKLVSDRLEQVYRGLGEMQSLAIGVGDLKRVLTNVKTRGTWGEIQLESLLEQVLTTEQYGKNVKTVPGSHHLVEFAVKLPGRDSNDQPVWLPIDAKFPKEQYERLLDAFDAANIEGVAIAGKALESAVKLEAKTIAEKYLSPPHTTDFAILFLPTEGLYAEIVKRAGLVDTLQREYRVTVAGPVTLTALLNALQMGFRTLALEKRSSEVWKVLGAVKTEFAKFGDVLAKTRDTLERAARNIESAETRSRAMERKLKNVEAIPESEAQLLMGSAQSPLDESEAKEG
jgi:DNA recombination protein RmuC